MIVLGNIEYADDDRIVIRDFHTGHLGLLPGTEVTVALPDHSQDAGSELLITPFANEAHYLCRLRCVFVDRPGVIQRLITAVASIGINILSLESASLEGQVDHVVYMLLDWSTTKDHREFQPLPAGTKNKFRDLENVLHLNDARHLFLVLRIIDVCGDILRWRTGTPSLPEISVSTFQQQVGANRQLTVIERNKIDEIGRAVTTIRIPRNILSRVRNFTSHAQGSLPYVVFSDTELRALRVYIPKRDRVRRILQVGFRHLDRPGNLATITRAVAANKFNVLQSLIRKKTSTENVWEALLEFNGPEEVPHDETQLEWVGGKLRSIDPEGCQRCNLELYIPTYFRRVPHVPKCRDYPIFDRSKEDQSLDPNFDLDPLRAERRKDRIPARRWLYELSDNYQASGRKPTVFFSYPYVAEKQANLVIQLLKKSNFDPKMYQPGMGPSGTIMVATVIELIRGADYFLGLWHPEANDPSTISPWLLFEFGVARALNKDCVFMCHEGLRQEVVLRIEKDRHQIKYNDLYFIRDSLEQLQDYCNHNWVDVR